MGLSDMIIAGVIICGAFYLLYHSLWKKKGHCHGCSGGCCEKMPRDRAAGESPKVR